MLNINKNIAIKLTVLFLTLFFCAVCLSKETSFIDLHSNDLEKQASVNWILSSSKKISKQEAKYLVNEVYKHSEKKGLNPALVIGLIKQESLFDKYAVSSSGAMGYTQVLPQWHQDKIKDRDLHSTSVSVDVGTTIIKDYLKLSKGNIRKALIKYSGNASNYFNKVNKNRLSLENYTSLFIAKQKLKGVYEVFNKQKIVISNKVKNIISLTINNSHILMLGNTHVSKVFKSSKTFKTKYSSSSKKNRIVLRFKSLLFLNRYKT